MSILLQINEGHSYVSKVYCCRTPPVMTWVSFLSSIKNYTRCNMKHVYIVLAYVLDPPSSNLVIVLQKLTIPSCLMSQCLCRFFLNIFQKLKKINLGYGIEIPYIFLCIHAWIWSQLLFGNQWFQLSHHPSGSFSPPLH